MIVLNCKRIEFKDKEKKPILGVELKRDTNYIYFKTRKGHYEISHDSISAIQDTDIEFTEAEK